MAFSIIRKARAAWHGDVDGGSGRISLGSRAFSGDYSLKARIGEAGSTTNPEELLGAAHAGCFTMALSSLLGEAGFEGIELATTANVKLEETPTGFSISSIELDAQGRADGLEEARFVELAEQAKATCPVSRALAGTEISLRARLAAPGAAL